jgi:hypothetical protein
MLDDEKQHQSSLLSNISTTSAHRADGCETSHISIASECRKGSIAGLAISLSTLILFFCWNFRGESAKPAVQVEGNVVLGIDAANAHSEFHLDEELHMYV